MVSKKDVMDSSINEAMNDRLPIEDMPLETLRDYLKYNEEARKINKKLRICKYPIKQCPKELHPTQRIRFANNDKSTNPVKVHLSNHLIHYDELLVPGNTYEVPEVIANYLAEKGYPVWDYKEGKNGERETYMVTKTPRFSVTTVMKEQESWMAG
jgi:hypothetical protein